LNPSCPYYLKGDNDLKKNSEYQMLEIDFFIDADISTNGGK